MEKLTIEEILPLLGKTFKDTLVYDEILGPYFFVRYQDGGYALMKIKRGDKGRMRYRVVCYPATFGHCLSRVASELLNEEGKAYTSLDSYISTWKEITENLTRVLKAANIE